MTKALLIARRELSSYLRSPLGYVVIAASLLIDGLYFFAKGLGAGKRLSSEVLFHFFDVSCVTTMIAAAVLSMRLVAGEREGGTLVLLGTAPVRERDVVLGKYLAALAILGLLAALSTYMPLLIFVNGRVAVGHVAVGYLGVLLLGASSLAVGVFASSIARTQLLSLIVTGALLGTLGLLLFVPKVTEAPLSDFLTALNPYPNRSRAFLQGKLEPANVAYYLGLAYFFLLAATKSLEARRWR
jgi:ABC-2 type transport system permease protein